MPAPHPPEFRRRAVELARERAKPIGELAKDLGISASCLRNWLAQANADENGSESRLTTAEKRELVVLRREKQRLEMENEILKRAALRSTGQCNTLGDLLGGVAWRRSVVLGCRR